MQLLRYVQSYSFSLLSSWTVSWLLAEFFWPVRWFFHYIAYEMKFWYIKLFSMDICWLLGPTLVSMTSVALFNLMSVTLVYIFTSSIKF